MKKILIFLLSVLAAASAFAFVACKDGEEPIESGEYMISDFESDAEYLTMLWENYFGKVDENEDPQYVVSGQRSARFEIHGYNKDNYTPTVTIYTNTDYNDKVDYTDTVSFEVNVYNTMSEDVNFDFTFYSATLAVGKGGWYPTQTLTAKAGQWNKLTVAIDRIDLSKNWGLDSISKFKFTFPDATDEDPIVLYFDKFIAHTSTMPIPDFEMEETHEVVKAGETYNIQPMEDTELQVYKDDVLVPELSSASSIDLEKGVYQIDYMRTFADGSKSRVKTAYVHAENAELVQLKAADCVAEPDRPGTLLAGLSDDTDYAIFDGYTALKMSGARDPDVPYGFTWNTGVTGTIKSVVLYVYNARDVNIRMWSQYAWPFLQAGTFFDITPKTWTRVEITGDFNDYANTWATGSPVKRDAETGEWQIFIPIQIWDTNYEVYLHALIEEESGDYVNVPLEEKVRYVEAGKEISVEKPEGATWIVKKDGEEVPSLANAEKFTPEAGEYTVEYTKTVGTATGTATCTIYAEDVANSWLAADSGTLGGPVSGIDLSGFSSPENMAAGGDTTLFGQQLVHVNGTTASPDIVMNWHTGLKGTVSNVTYYIYNNSEGQVRVRFNADANMIDMQPKSWTRFEIDGETFLWYQQNHGTVGAQLASGWLDGEEWILRFPLRVADVAQYDLYIGVLFEGDFTEVGQEPETPEIELTEDEYWLAAGTEFTVEQVNGAAWTVEKDGTPVDSLANAEKFTLEAGTYVIKYTRTSDSATAEATVYAEDMNSWLEADAGSLGGPVAGVDSSAFGTPEKMEVGGDVTLFDKDFVHVSGTTTVPDIMLNWHTGLLCTTPEDLVYSVTAVTYYFYNNSDGPVRFRLNADANIIDIPAKTWVRFEMEGDDFEWYAEQHGTNQSNPANGWFDNGEWVFRFPMRVADVAQYDVYIGVFFEGEFAEVGEEPQPDPELPAFELDQDEYFVAAGTEFTVEKAEGATWVVKKDGVAVDSLANAEKFTPEAGVYTLEYTRTADGATAACTIYAEDMADWLEVSNADLNGSDVPDNPAFGSPAEMEVGGEITLFGKDFIHYSGTKNENDLRATVSTGLSGTPDYITIYVYNNSDAAINARFNADANIVTIAPQSWIRLNIPADTFIWYQQNHGLTGSSQATGYVDTNGEWVFRFLFQIMNVSEYDLYIGIFFGGDLAEISA